MSSQASSPVWSCFEIAPNVNRAQCKLCPATISRGKVSHTTTSLWNHLQSKHLAKYKELKGNKSPSTSLPPSPSPSRSATLDSSYEDDDPDNPGVAASPSSTCSNQSSGSGASLGGPSPFKRPALKRHALPSGQPTLQECLEKREMFKPGDNKGKAITRLIAEMICKDNQPLSLVEDEGFTALLKHIEPRYAIPSRKHFSQTVIPEMYEDVKIKVAKLLEQTEFIGATTDMWTSTSCDDYLSLTVHFLDENFVYRHLCLECIPFKEVSHTASAIETFITNIFEEWNLSEKVVCIMRDNAPNMVAALQRSAFHHLPCLAHSFQLVIKDGLLDKTEIKEIMASCRSIVGHYKHSSKALKELRACQATLGLRPITLKQDEPTRWNSQLHMLNSLVEQKEAVLLSAAKLKFQINLTAEHWTMIEEVIRILDVFDRATFVASKSSVTISEVIPLVNSTLAALQKFTSTRASVQGFRNSLLASLKKRYQSVETEKWYALAALLDPRFKGSIFVSKTNFEHAKSSLAREIEQISNQADDSSMQPPEESQGDQKRGHSMWSFYSELMSSSTSSELSYSLTPEEEIHAYLAETQLPPDADIFKYWKENIKFQNLRALATKYLVTPLSTVFSERLFSTSGIIVDTKRSRLNPERVRMLVFLKKNLHLQIQV